MKKSIFQSIILLALIMVLACLFYLTPDKKSKNSHPVSSGSVSYIKPGSGIGGGDINGNAVAGKKSLPIYCVKHDDSEKCISISFDAACADCSLRKLWYVFPNIYGELEMYWD